jgi:uncharacterized protein (DUF2235 family)
MRPHLQRSTSRELSDNSAAGPARQRLAICLDGTWNRRDSGTNVYQLSTLIARGDVGGGWVQDVFYDPGVGTGVLDGVTGGAFGFGLSQNVRDAYAWLVERYRDDDEIYVFGFSRGAFTARSLVGLIAKCGLLRRGAPISNEELWSGYRILGRYRQERTGSEPARNWWERVAGRQAIPFRPVWLLVRDKWDDDDQGIPVQPPQNLTERLLRTWSRRIKITCVAVFDTVGSMGLDALAIPFLRDHTAQFHDTHLATLVVNGLQALAIDEQRANFVHIPWHREIDSGAEGTRHGGKVEQRWFVGSHSNVGGGYPDDVLAQLPLAWFVDEVRSLGLVFREGGSVRSVTQGPDVRECVPLLDSEKVHPGMSAKPPRVRDSYAEFGKGFWQYVIRSKREYRQIGPPPELRNGNVVQSVNERLDPSVEKLRTANRGAKPYLPPNLWQYLNGIQPGFAEPPRHRYIEGTVSAACLALWLAVIAVAGWGIGVYAGGPWWALVVGLPVVALLADWRESALNHAVALAPSGPIAERRMAWMEVCLAVRLGAIVALAAGLVIIVAHVIPWLLLGVPRMRMGWLLALDLLLVHVAGSLAWRGGPMADAGLRPIGDLRRQATPAGVVRCLRDWANGDASPNGQRLLMPVARSLWRDIFAFVPAYAALLFVGTWLAFSLAAGRLSGNADSGLILGMLARTPACWASAAAITVLCALANYVEDFLRLRHLNTYPASPSAASVRTAFAARFLRSVLFSLGLSIAGIGAAGLALLEVRDMFRGQTGGLGLLLVLFGGAVIYGALRGYLYKRRARPTATGSLLSETLRPGSLEGPEKTSAS